MLVSVRQLIIIENMEIVKALVNRNEMCMKMYTTYILVISLLLVTEDKARGLKPSLHFWR